MTVNEKVQPCDKILVPVFLTYMTGYGLMVDKCMFEQSVVICLRWQDSKHRVFHRIVVMPDRWYDQRNFYDPTERRWLYG